MKKGIFILSLLGLCLSLSAQEAQETEEKVKGAHPFKVSENEKVVEKFAHFSIVPRVGINVFDGDFGSEKKHAVGVPSLGMAVECNFTPAWTGGIEYMWEKYNVTSKGGNNEETLLKGNLHKIGAYIAMDAIPLFFPRSSHHLLAIEPMVGAGYMFYRTDIMYHDDYNSITGANPSHRRGQTKTYINADGEVGPDKMDKFDGTFFIQAGMNVEFNLNRTLALGVRATYNYFMHDMVDGRGYQSLNAVASKNNDGIFDITMNMRIKLLAVSRTHTRNFIDIHAFDYKQKALNAVAHDTVIIRHDSIIVRETTIERYSKESTEKDQYYYVYFDNAKANLDMRGLITIQQVAERLQEDPELYAVAIGYCDNTGTSKANFVLGDKRADVVVDELRAEHGIDENRLYGAGLGKVIGKRSTGSYAPNRRTAIRLVDKETFERMKEELEGKRESRLINDENDEPVSTNSYVEATVPLSESARPEKVNVYKQRTGESVATDKSTTLAKLARHYYNNTYCWVYIYIANMDKLKNPNDIKPGLQLAIPELTQQEMKITPDESLMLYTNARQGK